MAALFDEIEAGGVATPPWPPYRAADAGDPEPHHRTFPGASNRAGHSAVRSLSVANIHVERITPQCLALELAYRFTPEPYTRFFLYVGVAMVQTFALFLIGARIEDRRRESEVATQWRR